ncbi:MAG: hypothetical protein IPP42_17495 [Saprospiraceae bacterium]|nr:hypothetical protein [Saprospiraceae bacterium]
MYAQDLSGNMVLKEPECMENLVNFLDNRGKLKIVSTNPKGSFYNKLKSLKKEGYDIEVKRASEKYQASQKQLHEKFNYFTVADNRMFRAELDPNSHTAICSFNRPDESNVLVKAFELDYNSCIKLI